jgi:thiamine biosynthesis lipoprotein
MTATHVGRAWSCTVRLIVDDDAALPAAVQDLRGLLARVDAAASRFRADSALSRANQQAGRPTPVPTLLVDLVGTALEAARSTDGALDPTIGLAVRAFGYDRDIDVVAPDGPPVVGFGPATRTWHDVQLNREFGVLTVPAGTALDLGATAKAWTADDAATTLARRYRTAVLVELGGDVAVAGDRPEGWCIRVAEREGGPGSNVLVRRGGVTTSTTTVRAWRRGGETVHHLIDPRTARPATGPWRTVTVAACSALAANTASAAAVVMGERAVPWLVERALPARLVARDGAVHLTPHWPSREAAAA